LRRRDDDAENIPVPLNLANVKIKGEERLLQIRTNPPSPQCFSANRAPTKTTTPSKASRSRLTVCDATVSILNIELCVVCLREVNNDIDKHGKRKSLTAGLSIESDILLVSSYLSPFLHQEK
jgi:hypothetical protein